MKSKNVIKSLALIGLLSIPVTNVLSNTMTESQKRYLRGEALRDAIKIKLGTDLTSSDLEENSRKAYELAASLNILNLSEDYGHGESTIFSTLPVDVVIRSRDGETSIHKAYVGLLRLNYESFDSGDGSFAKVIFDLGGVEIDRDFADAESIEIQTYSIAKLDAQVRNNSGFGFRIYGGMDAGGKVKNVGDNSYTSTYTKNIDYDQGSLNMSDESSGARVGFELNYQIGSIVLTTGYLHKAYYVGEISYDQTLDLERCIDESACDVENPQDIESYTSTSSYNTNGKLRYNKTYFGADFPIYSSRYFHVKGSLYGGRERTNQSSQVYEQNFMNFNMEVKF